MGWEMRGGNLYYYRKVRCADGRVRSIYYGKNEPAKATGAAAQGVRRTTVEDLQEGSRDDENRVLEAAARRLEEIRSESKRCKRRRLIL